MGKGLAAGLVVGVLLGCSGGNADYDPSEGDGDGSRGDGVETGVGSVHEATSAAEGTTESVDEPQVEHLQNAPQGTCELPLWCFVNGNVWNPLGAPIAAQECFESSLTPPLRLQTVHAVVAARTPSLGPVFLRVRSWGDDERPGEVLAAVQLAPQQVETGDDELRIDELAAPIEIDTNRFCVGLELDDGGFGSALGMSVDQGSTLVGSSFLRIDGPGDCSIPAFVDVIARMPYPTGNWCIDVEVSAP